MQPKIPEIPSNNNHIDGTKVFINNIERNAN